MKIVFNRAKLTEAVTAAASFCPSRTPKDILKCLLFEASNDKCTIKSSDSENHFRIRIDVSSDTSVAKKFLLKAEQIASILREVTDDSVTMSVSAAKVSVSSGMSKFNIQTQDADDFPEFPDVIGEDFFVVRGKDLATMIKRTGFAVDEASKGYTMSGGCFDREGNQLLLASTDGKRLPVAAADLIRTEGEPVVSNTVIVPKKSLAIAARITPESEVKIGLTPNQFFLQSDDMTMSSMTVAGRFPDWRRVYNDLGAQFEIPLVNSVLSGVIRQAMIIQHQETRGANFLFENGMMSVSSVAADIGDSTIQVPISYEKESLSIRLDPYYIMDFCKVVDSVAQVSLMVVDKDRPVVFSTENYKCVIMTMVME